MIRVRLDDPGGPIICWCPVSPTGGWETFSTITRFVTPTAGTRDIYLDFTTPDNSTDPGAWNLLNLNWVYWGSFSSAGSLA